MIQAVNSVNFQGIFSRRYSIHTPKCRPYREFEFQPKLQEKNSVKKFINKLIYAYEEYKRLG